MSKSATTVRHVTQWIVDHIAIPCGICKVELEPEDAIQWDHIHAETFGGEHSYKNLRPVHKACNQAKGIQEHKDSAKIDRILGLTCNGPKKKIPSRPFQQGHQKMQSRGFQEKPESYKYNWGRRT